MANGSSGSPFSPSCIARHCYTFGDIIMCKAEAHDVVTLSKDAQVINSTSANLIKRATNNDCSDLYEKLTSLYDVAVNYVNHNNRTEGEMILGSQGTAALIYIMALTNNFKVCEEQASKFLWEKGHRILQLSGENYNSRKETIFSYRRLSNVKTK